jgi:hypothetical protein
MRIDAYTKIVLTIIAIALVWIAADGPSLVPAAEAQDRTPTRVVVVGWEEGGSARSRSLPLPIDVTGWTDLKALGISSPSRIPWKRRGNRVLGCGSGRIGKRSWRAVLALG